ALARLSAGVSCRHRLPAQAVPSPRRVVSSVGEHVGNSRGVLLSPPRSARWLSGWGAAEVVLGNRRGRAIYGQRLSPQPRRGRQAFRGSRPRRAKAIYLQGPSRPCARYSGRGVHLAVGVDAGILLSALGAQATLSGEWRGDRS